MTVTKKPTARTTWAWRRSIRSGEDEWWIAQLEAAGCIASVFTERPGRTRILLEAYFDSRAAAAGVSTQYGGRVRTVKRSEWIQQRRQAPIRIGRKLEIVSVKLRSRKKQAWPRLYIPHGIAFGSGEHATTYMLMRALASENWSNAADGGTTVLDLGTGSGVLALTARLLGVRKIVATDFDPDAIRTARENEALNFSEPLIRWRCADVKKLGSTVRYDLVLANLFSGILVEAAPQIAGSVSAGGQLWLSGILKAQQAEVLRSYLGQGMQLTRAVHRGKWVMLRLRAAD